MLVATVYRTGGGFSADLATALHRQVQRFLPGVDIVCLTNSADPLPLATKIPLRGNNPGWWAKMELFAPWMPAEDFLYLDLDTVVIGPLNDIASLSGFVTMEDVYLPGEVQSSVMLIPRDRRPDVWYAWKSDEHNIRHFQARGDQGFLQRILWDSVRFFQELLPGQLVSYKKHVAPSMVVPEGARAIVFHGRPRPWTLPKDNPIYGLAGYP